MLKALGKSILFGFLSYLLVTHSAMFVTVVMMFDEKSDMLMYLATLKHSLFLWTILTFAIVSTNIYNVKTTWYALIGRGLLIAGPISFGWAMLAQQGKDSWFLVGMFISSVFLMYEFVVVPKEKMKHQADTTHTKRNK